MGGLTKEDLASWRELAGRAAEPNPFFEPAMMLPAWRYVGGSGAISLLVVRDGSRWLACLPVRRAARFRKVPGPAMLAWVHTHCFLGTPLVDRDDVVGPLRALLAFAGDGPVAGLPRARAARRRRAGRRRAGGRRCEAEGMRAILYERAERAALRRRADGDYLHPDLKAKRRRELQRQRRRLEAQLGADQRERPRRRPAGDRAFLDARDQRLEGPRGHRAGRRRPPAVLRRAVPDAGRRLAGCSCSPSKPAITWPR